MTRWRDLTDAAGISVETLRAIRKGETAGMGSATEFKLERALRWAPGSIRAVMLGGDPMPVEDPRSGEPTTEQKLDVLEELLEQVKDQVARRMRGSRRDAAMSAIDLIESLAGEDVER